MADDFIELGAEMMGSGVDHWDKIAGVGGAIRRKAPSLRRKSRSRRQSTGDSRSEDSDRSTRPRGDLTYNDGGNHPWKGRESGRPGMRRRASSLDRDHFYHGYGDRTERRRSRDRGIGWDSDYEDGDGRSRATRHDRRRRQRHVQDVEEKTREELTQAREGFQSYKKDAASAVTAGVAGVAVVYAVEKMMGAYRARNEDTRAHHGSRKRATSLSSSPAPRHRRVHGGHS